MLKYLLGDDLGRDSKFDADMERCRLNAPTHRPIRLRAEYLDHVPPEATRGHLVYVLGNPAAFFYCDKCGAHCFSRGKMYGLHHPCKYRPTSQGVRKTGNRDRISRYRGGKCDDHPRLGNLGNLGAPRRMVHGDVEVSLIGGTFFPYGQYGLPPLFNADADRTEDISLRRGSGTHDVTSLIDRDYRNRVVYTPGP